MEGTNLRQIDNLLVLDLPQLLSDLRNETAEGCKYRQYTRREMNRREVDSQIVRDDDTSCRGNEGQTT